MVDLVSLWLPILIAAVLVFVASSVIHIVLPIHKCDFGQLPREADVLGALLGHGLKPGEYMFPYATSMKAYSTPEFTEQLNKGPVGFMTVMPNGPANMGKALLQWFVFSLVISAFVGYIGTLALPKGADYGDVFRVTGTVAILGYAFSNVNVSIWKGGSWTTTLKFVFDGVIYGLVTAGAFGSMWPGVGE